MPKERFFLILIYDFLAGPLIITLFPSTLLSSLMTIAFAPSGIGAPVVILRTSPDFIDGGVLVPA